MPITGASECPECGTFAYIPFEGHCFRCVSCGFTVCGYVPRPQIIQPAEGVIATREPLSVASLPDDSTTNRANLPGITAGNSEQSRTDSP
jgi:hypothetical protein